MVSVGIDCRPLNGPKLVATSDVSLGSNRSSPWVTTMLPPPPPPPPPVPPPVPPPPVTAVTGWVAKPLSLLMLVDPLSETQRRPPVTPEAVWLLGQYG